MAARPRPALPWLDEYIVARLALWAGDFEYCSHLLGQLPSPLPDEDNARGKQGPEGIVREAARVRLEQLRSRQKEFALFKQALLDEGDAIEAQPMTIFTRHLRGTIWRIDAEQFEMRGYLSELKWEGQFYQLVDRLLLKQPTGDATNRSGKHFGPERRWVASRDPFIRASVTDLGQIHATGIWTGTRLPRDKDELARPFVQLLETLDVQDTQSVQSSS